MKLLFLLGCLALALPAHASWGHDPEISSAWMDYTGTDPVSLFVVPDGSGSPLTEAMPGYGGTVNATIHVRLLDYSGNPIVGFPAEDMWLESLDGGLVFCPLGTMADGPTDLYGLATWTGPLRGGGFSEAVCLVMINGSALFQSLPLHFNSPDLNGDLVVNLADVGPFAVDFFGFYRYRSDFYFDGMLNLMDLGRMAAAMQASCP